jgi:predicted AAA+ superfamily ATPase
MIDPRIGALLDRLETLLDRGERLLPKHHETNWKALAYRWRSEGYLQSIEHIDGIHPKDLLNIDRQKKALLTNTVKFLSDLPANHALLWGSRGTGKSSLIKSLLQEFSEDGLRLIEVDKKDLINLSDIIQPLYERKEKYILFSDDLSFEADDPGYKSLKATLDGSIEKTPTNVLIYATSNRRHLMPESMRDNYDSKLVDGELHHSDAVEEKISLSERFGLWLSFQPFTQDQYLDIVNYWLKQTQIKPKDEKPFRKEALKFALYRGSRSGRVAKQFINHWTGIEDL